MAGTIKVRARKTIVISARGWDQTRLEAGVAYEVPAKFTGMTIGDDAPLELLPEDYGAEEPADPVPPEAPDQTRTVVQQAPALETGAPVREAIEAPSGRRGKREPRRARTRET